jgi:hypothetical protein
MFSEVDPPPLFAFFFPLILTTNHYLPTTSYCLLPTVY